MSEAVDLITVVCCQETLVSCNGSLFDGLISKHDPEHAIDDSWISVGSADGNVRYNSHVAFADDLH